MSVWSLILLCVFLAAGIQAQDKKKYGRKGAKARKAWLKIPEKKYDPNTKVYIDALWMLGHEENCPMCVLKSLKKTMTLEEADKAGYRIGESGQSGRERCCFKGCRRKSPEKGITEDAIKRSCQKHDEQKRFVWT